MKLFIVMTSIVILLALRLNGIQRYDWFEFVDTPKLSVLVLVVLELSQW